VPIAFKPIRNLLYNDSGRCMILNILGILADGSVSICGIGVLIPELAFGHIAKSNLGSIWIDSPEIKAFRKAIPDKLEGVCGECLHRNSCLGTCVANNFHRAKRFTAPYFFCQDTDRIGIFPKTRKIKYNLQGVHP
jgi:radical SAM protein with 4Fe4S-binding SPASM domain